MVPVRDCLASNVPEQVIQRDSVRPFAWIPNEIDWVEEWFSSVRDRLANVVVL